MMRESRFVDALGCSQGDRAYIELVRSLPKLGSVTSIENLTYVKYSADGISFDFGSGDKLLSVFFKYQVADLEWATGIPRDAGRSDVIHKYGPPRKSGEPKAIPVLGKQGAWDRWDFGEYSMHVQYAHDEDKVMLVTLMHPSALPESPQ